LILTAMTFDKKYMYIPFVGIFASDLLLEYFNYYEFNYLFSSLFFLNYGTFLAIYFAMKVFNKRDSLPLMGFNVFFAPTLFFIISNFIVWLTSSGVYPYTISGLMYCYEMGIPFYRHHLVSTMIFTPVLFAPDLLLKFIKSKYLVTK